MLMSHSIHQSGTKSHLANSTIVITVYSLTTQPFLKETLYVSDVFHTYCNRVSGAAILTTDCSIYRSSRYPHKRYATIPLWCRRSLYALDSQPRTVERAMNRIQHSRQAKYHKPGRELRQVGLRKLPRWEYDAS
jgi:hypothetical protein